MPSQIEQKPYRDARVEADLLKAAVDDKAYSRLMRDKRDLGLVSRLLDGVEDAEANQRFEYYDRLLKDIPAGATCECCGFKNLIHIVRVNGRILGPECSQPNHPFGSCRKLKAMEGR